MSSLATLVDVLKNYVVGKVVTLALGENSTVLLLNEMSRKIIRIMSIFFSHSFTAHLDIITSFISPTECTTRFFYKNVKTYIKIYITRFSKTQQ